MSDIGPIIGGLVVLSIVGIVYYVGILPGVFRRLQLPGMLRRRGWADKTDRDRLSRSELAMLQQASSDIVWREVLRITGTHRGHQFCAVQRMSSIERRDAHESLLEVTVGRGLPVRDISVGLFTGRIKGGAKAMAIPPELEQWLKRNRFRCRRLGTRSGAVTTDLGHKIYRAKLLRRLNFLIDVAEQMPTAHKKPKKPRN